MVKQLRALKKQKTNAYKAMVSLAALYTARFFIVLTSVLPASPISGGVLSVHCSL